jgi:hypothetical protein
MAASGDYGAISISDQRLRHMATSLRSSRKATATVVALASVPTGGGAVSDEVNPSHHGRQGGGGCGLFQSCGERLIWQARDRSRSGSNRKVRLQSMTFTGWRSWIQSRKRNLLISTGSPLGLDRGIYPSHIDESQLVSWLRRVVQCGGVIKGLSVREVPTRSRDE